MGCQAHVYCIDAAVAVTPLLRCACYGGFQQLQPYGSKQASSAMAAATFALAEQPAAPLDDPCLQSAGSCTPPQRAAALQAVAASYAELLARCCSVPQHWQLRPL